MKKLLFILFVGVAQFNCIEGKRKRVFFREVKPTTSEAIIRSQRGIIPIGYQNRVVEQHGAATIALEEARRSSQATGLLVENLQASIKLRQQLGNQDQMSITPGPIRLVDQYGNVFSGIQELQKPQDVEGGGYSYPRPSISQTLPQKTETEQSSPVGLQNTYLPPQPQPSPVGTQNAYLPPQPQVQVQPQQQQLVYSQTQYLPPPTYLQPQLQPQPQYIQPQPQPQFIQNPAQPQQLFQQFVTPEGLVFHQLVEQPQSQPLSQQITYHHPQPQPIPQVVYDHPQPQPLPQVTYHHPQYQPQTTVVQEPLQIYHQPIPIRVETSPLPFAQKVIQPVLEKVIQPIVTKVEEVPTVKIVKQPILSPAVFQKEIFAVKNPSVRVLTYSDLCTVYPYQSKLSACVYKKAAIPELHHPDIQLVPEQTKIVTQAPPVPPAKTGAGYGEGRINPRITPLRLLAPTTATRNGAESIQDILRRGNKNSVPTLSSPSSEASSEGGEEMDDEDIPIVQDDENTNIAESSNKKEKLVIRTTKQTSPSPSTARRKSKKAKKGSLTTRAPPTTTSPSTSTTSTTRKSKKSKRRSRNNKARRAERRNKQQSSTSTVRTTTIEELFRLA